MSTKDFNFLYRKEILILFCFLITITFSQIALEKNIRISEIPTLAVLNNPLLEALGLVLPLFVSIYLIFSHLSKSEVSWLPPNKWIITFSLIYLLIVFFPIPEPIEEEENPISEPEETVTTDTPISRQSTTSEAIITPEATSEAASPPFQNISWIAELRNLLLISILFVPLLIIIIIQRRSKFQASDTPVTDYSPDDDKITQHKIRSILECYYQASTSLEERGADSSPSLTPFEFYEDVAFKDLCPPPDIKDLTGLFEEAKFSNHEIPFRKVEVAKSLAYRIIFTSQPSFETESEKTKEEKK